MNRLTEFDFDTYRSRKPKQWVVDKLAEYEDTGLEPHEVVRLKEDNKMLKDQRIAELKTENYHLKQELNDIMSIYGNDEVSTNILKIKKENEKLLKENDELQQILKTWQNMEVISKEEWAKKLAVEKLEKLYEWTCQNHYNEDSLDSKINEMINELKGE